MIPPSTGNFPLRTHPSTPQLPIHHLSLHPLSTCTLSLYTLSLSSFHFDLSHPSRANRGILQTSLSLSLFWAPLPSPKPNPSLSSLFKYCTDRKLAERSERERASEREYRRSNELSPMESPLLQNRGEAEEAWGSNGTGTNREDKAADLVVATPDSPPVTTAREAWEVFSVESRKLWWIATPIAFQMLCVYGMNSATQIFVGHLGNLELSAVAIGLSVVANFSFGFMLGMGSALETLCGQAYGAGQVEMLGIYMQRSCIILFASACLMCPIYIFATPILKLLGQEDDLAKVAGRFTLLILPEIFSFAFNFPTQKFLQAQSKVQVLAWIGFGSLLFHIGLLALFINVFGWGITGAAVAFNISMWLVAIAQVIYVVGWCKEGWTGLSWSAFHDMWAFVRLSVESAVMLCLEIWYMMVLVVLTGHLKDAEIAVGSISVCMNINGWEAMLFIALNAAISVRVSNELGSGHPRACKYAVAIVVATSLAIGLFFMVVILATRDYFGVIFTSDKELQQAVTKIAYLLAITMVLNSVQPVISGVAIGSGWQGLVAYINLGCYYVFGLPLGFLLGYYFQLGAQGIWAGMLCGTALQTLILLFIVWKTNWNHEADQAIGRVRMWGGQDEVRKSET